MEIIFYALAPKPAASGGQTYTAAAAGKVSRGRKWFRLECHEEDIYYFPPHSQPEEVYEWLTHDTGWDMLKFRGWVAFAIEGGGLFPIDNAAALDSVPNGAAARDHALEMQKKGREGWVVFIPEEA